MAGIKFPQNWVMCNVRHQSSHVLVYCTVFNSGGIESSDTKPKCHRTAFTGLSYPQRYTSSKLGPFDVWPFWWFRVCHRKTGARFNTNTMYVGRICTTASKHLRGGPAAGNKQRGCENLM